MRLSNVQVSAEYEGTAKRLIARLKFDCNRQVVSVLAKTMVDNLPFFGEETLVVPVPTAPARVRQRGFDHTLLLAKEIAKHRNLTFAKPVVRTDNNRQVGADRKIRIAQAKGSYRIRGNTAIQDKHIILIDDIVTTGATLRAVSQILKDAGAASVYAAVFAYSS